MAKHHWFAFCFVSGLNGELTHASAYVGIDCASGPIQGYKVTLQDIQEAKQVANVPNNAVLISVSYLGMMTSEEFKNGVNNG